MAKVLIADNDLSRASGAVLSVVAENANHPGSNLHAIQPWKLYKSTSGNATMKVDLGLPKRVSLVSLLHVQGPTHGRNLLANPDDFSAAEWTADGVDATALSHNVDAPEGLDGPIWAVTEDDSDGFHDVKQTYTKPVGTPVTFTASVYCQKIDDTSGYNRFRLRVEDGSTGYAEAFFDVNAGDIFGSPGAVLFSNVSAELVDTGDGITYRATLTATSNSTTSLVFRMGSVLAADADFVGRDDAVVRLWRPQLELGSAATAQTQSGDSPGWLWRIRADDVESNLTSSPDYDSGLLHIPAAAGDLTSWASQHAYHYIADRIRRRYFQINAYGSGTFAASRLRLDDAWSPADNIEIGNSIETLEEVTESQSRGGQIYRTSSGRARLLRMDFRKLSRGESSFWSEAERRLGQADDLVVIENPDDHGTAFAQERMAHCLFDSFSALPSAGYDQGAKANFYSKTATFRELI